MADEPRDIIEALAEVWASIDGRLLKFQMGRDGPDDWGTYEGYMAEAEEMTKRLAKRGYAIVRVAHG